MRRKPLHELAAASRILDVQQNVSAVILLRSITQHRRLNLGEINGGRIAAQVRSTAVFHRRHRTLLKIGLQIDGPACSRGGVTSSPVACGFAVQLTLSRNSSSALPTFSSRLVSTTVKFGLATYQK